MYKGLYVLVGEEPINEERSWFQLLLYCKVQKCLLDLHPGSPLAGISQGKSCKLSRAGWQVGQSGGCRGCWKPLVSSNFGWFPSLLPRAVEQPQRHLSFSPKGFIVEWFSFISIFNLLFSPCLREFLLSEHMTLAPLSSSTSSRVCVSKGCPHFFSLFTNCGPRGRMSEDRWPKIVKVWLSHLWVNFRRTLV